MDEKLALLLSAVIGYLLGSISTGILFSRHLGQDIRTVGSKNAGATNMTRVHGLRPGVITFAGDCLKGVAAALAGKWLGGQAGAIIAGTCAILGHNWPVFFGFKGGKGVATCIGIGLVTYPPFGLLGVAAGASVMLISKYVSLGSLVGTGAFAIGITIAYGIWPLGLWAIALFLLALWRHRGNVERLLRGTERKIGQKEG